MPWVESLADPQELRRCIRDLVALSTLPAIWTGYGPQQIADSVAAALVSMLDADFIYVALPEEGGRSLIEVIHPGDATSPASVRAIRDALRRDLVRRSERTAVIADPIGGGTLRLASAPVGFGGTAVLVAGSSRQPDFPTEVQRLLLSIAANDTAVALQRWQAEADERRFVSLIERSPDFIGVASLDGRPQYVNPAGLAIVGLSQLDRDCHVFDFLAPEERGRARDLCWPLAISSGRWSGELNFRHFRTGNTIPFLVDWFRIDNPRTGDPMNIATVSRDLTARNQAEASLRHLNETLEQRVARRTIELADANEKLVREIDERRRADARSQKLQHELAHAGRLSTAGQMAAAMAHEINQPLTAVINSVNAARRLLSDSGRDRIGTVREIMEEAVEQSLRVGQIIRRLRDFVTRGETEKRIESVAALVLEASALAQTGSGMLGTQIRYDFDPGVSIVLANRIQIQQVLVNLIRNALEAMAHTERPALDLTTRGLAGDMVEIAVADSGPGISAEVAARLFEPFISTKPDGMGLGLSICRSIVEAHGGELGSEPNPTGGTIFRFTLPAAPVAGESRDG
ncbi:MAG: two-component system, LuxR family, sensor kinase FixL [Alphaproteobacteria bacterium]|nr:two-component system, LuxR family, sensor kinase FixL [Alphaproteobacteria bacterium]